MSINEYKNNEPFFEARLLDAKRELYAGLLAKPAELWTESDIELGHTLSLDPQIQSFLSARLGTPNVPST